MRRYRKAGGGEGIERSRSAAPGQAVAAPAALRLDRLPPAVLRLCRVLETADGGAAYVVGGAVRDLLGERAGHDYDVATPLWPEAATRVLAAAGFHVVPTGIRFGTVTAIDAADGRAVEVTTLRAEGAYRDRRHPDRVEWTTDVAQDLARRDFTVNAMAWRPLGPSGASATSATFGDGTLTDPFGGRRDLAARRLRAVGEAERRFREDPLRVARLFRLAAEHAMTPEARTLAAARVVAPDLAAVARERVRDELERLIVAPHLWSVGEGVARILLPAAIPEWREITDFEESRWRGSLGRAALFDKQRRIQHKPVDLHSVLAVSRCPPRPRVRWAALLHDLGKPRTFALSAAGRVTFYGHEAEGARLARAALAGLRLPPHLVDAVCALIAVHLWPWEAASPAGLRRLVRNLGEAGARDLLELHRADVEASTPLGWPLYEAARAALEAELAPGAAFEERALAVDGHDVMRVLGIGPGAGVGRALGALMEIVLDDPAENDRCRLLLRLAERRFGGRSDPAGS